MVIHHPSNKDGAGLSSPRRFTLLPAPNRSPGDRVRLRQFSFQFATRDEMGALVHSLKDNLQWMLKRFQEGSAPPLPPASAPPTYNL